MSDQLENAKPLTSTELLNAALFRELNSEEPRKPEAIVDTLSTILGTWESIEIISLSLSSHRQQLPD